MARYKVYVSKYALSYGLVEGEITRRYSKNEYAYVTVKIPRKSGEIDDMEVQLQPRHWHYSLVDAREAVTANLKKEIARLNKRLGLMSRKLADITAKTTRKRGK